MNEVPDLFPSVSGQWHKVTPVWQLIAQPILNHIAEFTLDKKQRQNKFCLTVEVSHTNL